MKEILEVALELGCGGWLEPRIRSVRKTATPRTRRCPTRGSQPSTR
jgi:hypothetical protein